MLRVNRVHYPVTALGPGRRLGVWLQGCPLACPGCMSTDTWDESGGTAVTTGELADMWQAAVADGADGLTVSGGEPLTQPAPLSEFLAVADRIRADAMPRADFLLYTGFEIDELDSSQAAVLDQVDAVITGRFRVELPTRLIWRGSANQVLEPRTDLGEHRYRDHVNRTVDRQPVQVTVEDGRVWLIGVPPRGALRSMERAMLAQGIRFGDVAWRR